MKIVYPTPSIPLLFSIILEDDPGSSARHSGKGEGQRRHQDPSEQERPKPSSDRGSSDSGATEEVPEKDKAHETEESRSHGGQSGGGNQ